MSRGLLSLNERNISYIKKYNPAKRVRLADNKAQTKNYLGSRGIPVPETFVRLHGREDLRQLSFGDLPDHFVIKPNKGSKGQGILIVTRTGDDEYRMSGETVDEDRLRREMVDILDGRYSLGQGPDSVLIEEKIGPGDGFAMFCEHGLADIRVICFNLVPVAAMVRIPTALSGGKANLATGGAGCGIEIGTGKIQTYYQQRKVYTTAFPEDFAGAYQYKMPYRDDILHYSAKIQYFVNIGYLALDWVITPTGPKILEINARAGNEIQNVSLTPLKKRLDKVEDLKIDTPEKGVEICKSLFASKAHLPQEKIIYLTQRGLLTLPDTSHSSSSTPIDVLVRVDLSREESACSTDIAQQIQDGYRLRLPLSEITWTKKRWQTDHSLDPGTFVLSATAASRYLLKPIKKTQDLFTIVNADYVNESETQVLTTLDRAITKISRRLNLVRLMRPDNYLEELDRFLTWKGKYNPTFVYKRPKKERLDRYAEELARYEEQYFGSDSPLESRFATLLHDKIGELMARCTLLRAHGAQDYDAIAQTNRDYFAPYDEDRLVYARDLIAHKSPDNSAKLGPTLTLSQQRVAIETYLRMHDITEYEIELTSQGTARIAVRQKAGRLIVALGTQADIRRDEMDAVLAHEIATHVRRSQNGRRSGWQILAGGTAYYETHEEGLAIYNAHQCYPDEYVSYPMYEKYVWMHDGASLPFVQYANMIRDQQPYRSWERLFRTTVRAKRGIMDTGARDQCGGFAKDKIYYDGYIHIRDWLADGGDLASLYIGKVKTSDIAYIV